MGQGVERARSYYPGGMSRSGGLKADWRSDVLSAANQTITFRIRTVFTTNMKLLVGL